MFWLREIGKKKVEKDIYEVYLNGPFDWFNPVDIFADILTAGPTGNWSNKSHREKVYEISKQYPMLSIERIDSIISEQKKLRGIS